MLENLKAMNFNTVYVHASAFTDAYYPSQYYPTAQYVAGQIGQNVTYDPFGLFVQQAHEAGFHIEAWINPMRSFRTDPGKSDSCQLGNRPVAERSNDARHADCCRKATAGISIPLILKSAS